MADVKYKMNTYNIWNNWDFLYISTPSLNNTGLTVIDVSGLVSTYGFAQAFMYETNRFYWYQDITGI